MITLPMTVATPSEHPFNINQLFKFQRSCFIVHVSSFLSTRMPVRLLRLLLVNKMKCLNKNVELGLKFKPNSTFLFR